MAHSQVEEADRLALDFERRLEEACRRPGLLELQDLADRCARAWQVMDAYYDWSRTLVVYNSTGSVEPG